MLFRYFYDEKLAHASYLVGCQRTGEAIIIDPSRHLEPYFEMARKEGVRITAAAETHIHADYVSGARELAVSHGATLYLSAEGGPEWQYQYAQRDGVGHELLHDGQSFKIGNLLFEVMHTPGHTPESISFLLTDRGGAADEPMGIFTGDFIFVGDVGRPDLLEKAAGISGTSRSGAQAMFRSLQRFRELPDYLQVWPAHGAGSACGKALGAVPSTTVGYEKRFNWAFQHTDEAPFIVALLEGQPEPPTYFAAMKRVNKVGPALLRELPSLIEFENVADLDQMTNSSNANVRVIDTRPSGEFARGHVAGHYNIPANKAFANWAGWLLREEDHHVLVVRREQVDELIVALRSVGHDSIVGWIEPDSLLSSVAPDRLESYVEMTPAQLQEQIRDGSVSLLDVRNLSEWNEGHIAQAKHLLLGTIPQLLMEVPNATHDKPLVVQCQAGGRSAIAASVLQANGIKPVINMIGGYARWLTEVGT